MGQASLAITSSTDLRSAAQTCMRSMDTPLRSTRLAIPRRSATNDMVSVLAVRRMRVISQVVALQLSHKCNQIGLFLRIEFQLEDQIEKLDGVLKRQASAIV